MVETSPTFLQHCIDMRISQDCGFDDSPFPKRVKEKRLKFEDDTDVQFDLAKRAYRACRLQGRREEAEYWWENACLLVAVRERLALTLSIDDIFIRTPSELEFVTHLMSNQVAPGQTICDYQIKELFMQFLKAEEIMNGTHNAWQFKPSSRKFLKNAEIRSLQAAAMLDTRPIKLPDTLSLNDPNDLTDLYCEAIDPETKITEVLH